MFVYIYFLAAFCPSSTLKTVKVIQLMIYHMSILFTGLHKETKSRVCLCIIISTQQTRVPSVRVRTAEYAQTTVTHTRVPVLLNGLVLIAEQVRETDASVYC